MRVAGRIGALVALWLLAWGDLTVANIISGVAVASLLLVAFPLPSRSDIRVHPLATARLVAYIAAQLVTSNIVMARQILRPSPVLQPGVLAHRLRRPSEEVVTVMTSVISLSPGTMTVDVDPDSTTVYVHFLLLSDVDAARASLEHLEHLVARALSQPGVRRTAGDPADIPADAPTTKETP